MFFERYRYICTCCLSQWMISYRRGKYTRTHTHSGKPTTPTTVIGRRNHADTSTHTLTLSPRASTWLRPQVISPRCSTICSMRRQRHHTLPWYQESELKEISKLVVTIGMCVVLQIRWNVPLLSSSEHYCKYNKCGNRKANRHTEDSQAHLQVLT